MAFVFTDEMNTISNQLWAYLSAVGASLCFLALLIIGAVWAHPRSRRHLDRVSFRIVCYALVANMVFGISSAVGGMWKGPGFGCGLSIFLLMLTLQISSFLLFCIALNLMLVIVYRFNGKKMERWYIIGSCVISLCLAIPPYAAGQYGWDPLVLVCWYTNPNTAQRLAWQIGTQMAWTALVVLGEVIASFMVVWVMLRHQRRLAKTFQVASSATKIGATSTTGTGMSSQVVAANKLKAIIIRVALYPIASCIVNLLSIFCAIHNTVVGGVHNQHTYNILLLSDFLYGGRAVVYALLALSDPALTKGMRVLYFHLRYGMDAQYESSTIKTRSRSGTLTQPGATQSFATPPGQLQVRIELSTIKDYTSPPGTGKDGAVTDGTHALNHKQDPQYAVGRGVDFIDIDDGSIEASGSDVEIPERRDGVERRASRMDVVAARMNKEEEKAFVKQI